LSIFFFFFLYMIVEEELLLRLRRAAATPIRPARAPVGQSARGAPVSFDALFRKADAYVDRHVKRYALLTSRIWTPAEMYASPLFDRGATTITERHAIVDRIRDDAKLFRVSGGHGPHAFQIELIEFWLELSAPYIYGEFWQTDYVAAGAHRTTASALCAAAAKMERALALRCALCLA
jgi:hypothetical protein